MSETVSDLGYQVLIIGRRLGTCCDEETIPFRTKRLRMLFRKGFFFYAFFNIRLFIYLLFRRIDILVANDLDTLFPNYLISRIRQIPLVYDSHEYFTGVPELNKRPFVRSVWKSIEKRIFPHLKTVITVTESLAGIYEKEYNLRPAVVRNCSRISSSVVPFPREKLGIDNSSFLLILQGGGINIDKGAEELVKAVCMTQNVSLLVAGSGDVIPLLKKMVRGLNIEDKVKFVPKIPWSELMRYTKSADAGMCLEKDTNINYRYSLPNKLFDYISAGIPVIAGDLPEIKKIIEENDCGIILQAITPEEISHAIIKLRDDVDLRRKLGNNSAAAAEILNWNRESEIVKRIYTNL